MLEHQPETTPLPSPAPARPPFLRRAWVGWTVALVVAGAGAALAPWLVGEREDLSQELAGVRESMKLDRAALQGFEEQIENRRRARDELRDGLDLCSKAIRSEQALQRAAVAYMDAFRGPGGQAAVDERFEILGDLRKRSNDDLRTCQRIAHKNRLRA